MATFGWPNLTIELDTTEGGSLGDMSAYITEFNGLSPEAVLEEITAAGDTSDRWAAVGLTRKNEITMTGPYDNTTDKLVHATKDAGDLGETRTLKVTYDTGAGADILIVEAIIMRVERNTQRDRLHQYTVTLRPTGAIS